VEDALTTKTAVYSTRWRQIP